MKILVGCEESQEVTKAFRALGYEAYSCDIQECSGGHPEWHLQMDIFSAINLGNWDMMVAFPPCTHIANAGGTHFEGKRRDGRQKEAIEFFMKLLAAPIERIALENPVGILSSDWYIQHNFAEMIEELQKVNMPRKPDQVIQPFYFGDKVRKYTCLWLKNLPPLTWSMSDNLFEKSYFVLPEEPTTSMIRQGNYRPGTVRKMYWQDMLPKKDRAKIKSKTFPGIAKAIAKQWGAYLTEQKQAV